MLIADGKLLPPGRRNGRAGTTIAVAVSTLLHAAALALLLLRPGRALLPPPVPPLEIEMVQQSAEVRGAPPPPQTGPSPATPPAPATPPSPDAPPLPPKPQAPAPSAPAPQAAPAAQARQPAPARAAPEVNLGSAAQDLDPLIVTGENVVPPRPDARYRNLPPHYPAAAAKSGAEGMVQLVARIAPNGLPLSVGVVESSGNFDLDEEARRAVLLWRFRPAQDGGRAVPYDYVVNIHFSLNDRQAQPSEK